MDRATIITSENPGYIARVSCAFEQAGLRHELDVYAGKMMISVPNCDLDRARALLSNHNLRQKMEPPGPGFTHLEAMDQEELEAVLIHPEGWTAGEICAARHLVNMRETECQCIEQLIEETHSGFTPTTTLRSLDRNNRLALASLTFLIPPIALLLCCFVFLHKTPTFRGHSLYTYCPASRQFTGWLLPLTSLTTLLLLGLFVSL